MKLLVPTARVRCWFNPVLPRGYHRSRISCGEVHRNHDRSGEKTFRGVAISSCARYMPISAKPDDYTKELRCKRCRGREPKFDSGARAFPCLRVSVCYLFGPRRVET